MFGTIAYEEVSDIFFVNSVWVGDGEFSWYVWGWKILEEHNLTRFSNFFEKALVYLRAYTLVYIHCELCEKHADISFEYEVLPDKDYLSQFTLGYVLAKTTHKGADDENIESIVEGESLFLCVETQRSIVAEALNDTSNDQSSLQVFLNATSENPDPFSKENVYSHLGYEWEITLDWLVSGTRHLKDGF